MSKRPLLADTRGLTAVRRVAGLLVMTTLLALVAARSVGLRDAAAGGGTYVGPFASLGLFADLAPIAMLALLLTALALVVVGYASLFGSSR